MNIRALLAPAAMLALASCGTAPPSHPPLSPQVANQLLHYNQRAVNHLKFVQHENSTCDYVLHLPDQSSNPSSVVIDHIVNCGGRTDFKAYDASVEYEWNKAEGKWEITHFGN